LKKKKPPKASAHTPRIATATPIPAFTPVDSSFDSLSVCVSVSVGVAGRAWGVVVGRSEDVGIVVFRSEDVVDVMLVEGEVELDDEVELVELEVELGLDFGFIQK
jgi:hypothetical protein